MTLIEFPIVIFFIPSQYWNALSPIFSPPVITTSHRDVGILSPKIKPNVTFSLLFAFSPTNGIDIFVKESHLENAPYEM